MKKNILLPLIALVFCFANYANNSEEMTTANVVSTQELSTSAAVLTNYTLFINAPMSEHSAPRPSENNDGISSEPVHFIEQIIQDDLKNGKHRQIHTRFPPEPNGYLHIGHAKAICLSFGLADKYNGLVNLRFDDTNPEKESQEYVDAIRRDLSWLGYNWSGGEFYTSDYFEQLYGFAVRLIEKGRIAWLDDFETV